MKSWWKLLLFSLLPALAFGAAAGDIQVGQVNASGTAINNHQFSPSNPAQFTTLPTFLTALGLGTGNTPVFTGLTLSGLTSGRVPFVSTGGLLVDSSAFTFSAGALTIGSNLTFGTSASLLNGTTGSIGLTATGTNQSITITPTGTGAVAFTNPTYAAYRPKRSFPFSGLPLFPVEGRGMLIYDDATGTPSGTPQAYFGVATKGGAGNSGFAGLFMVDEDAPTTSQGWEFHMEGGDGLLYLIQLNSTGQLTGKNLKVNTSGDLSLSSTTSGSGTTSAAITAKSIGLTENIRVGGLAAVAGNLTVTSNAASTSTTTGAVVVTGGMGVSAKLNVADDVVSGTSTNFIVGGGFKAMRSGARAALQLDTYDSSTTGGSYFAGQRARGTSASPTAVATGDQLLAFLARGYAATTNDFTSTVASLRAEAAEGFTNTNQGANLVLLTTPIGSTSSALSASLTLSGGATPTWTGGTGNLTVVSGTGNSIGMNLKTTTAGGTATSFLVADATQGVTLSSLAGTGSRTVVADANGLLSAPTSDELMKEPLRPLPESYGLETVMRLKPSLFKYKDRSRYGSQDYLGFGARATAAVLPEVTGQDRNGTYYLTDEKITAVLVKAVQQQQAQIENLRSQLEEMRR